VFWVETKGLTLEEVDALFEGEKHSTVPNIEAVRRGAEVNVPGGAAVYEYGGGEKGGAGE